MTEPPHEFFHAQLDWDEQGQPLSCAFGDVYFSRANGLEETRHVFLQHNHLAERFATLTTPFFCIGETGFGSGLNFLATWQLWDQYAPADACLHFITTEKYPLKPDDLARALNLWPELASYTQPLIAHYPVFMGEGFHRLVFVEGRVKLTLIIGDAAAGLEHLRLGVAESPSHFVDAWFLDGFAPAKNPQMWSPELFAAMARLSGPGTTAATFSAAGIVKQGLRQAGFIVQRVAGYGRKREMVSARMPDTPKAPDLPVPQDIPWYLVRCRTLPRQRHALVIGGGLAGCHIARSLAERGWQVRLLEREPALATAASGNPQGMVYARLSPKQETLATFNLACLQYALRHYQPYWQQGSTLGQACGLLQLEESEDETRLQAALASQLVGAESLVRRVSPTEASDIAGLRITRGGLFFPGAGWLNPRVLCQALVEHPNIQCLTANAALALEQIPDGWRVTIQATGAASQPGHKSLEANVAIIANARDALAFEQSQHLPLKSIRGQVTYLKPGQASLLRTVVCGEGYLAPPQKLETGAIQQCAGASFNLHDTSEMMNPADHRANLDKLLPLLPDMASEWASLNPNELSGRVAFRCTSPDYLPLVGPVPVASDFLQDYALLRKGTRHILPLAGSYWPGLYLSLAYGSRGLAYTPLCAELLAAQICDEPLPLGKPLVTALNPARFLIRDLKRNRRQ